MKLYYGDPLTVCKRYIGDDTVFDTIVFDFSESKQDPESFWDVYSLYYKAASEKLTEQGYAVAILNANQFPFYKNWFGENATDYGVVMDGSSYPVIFTPKTSPRKRLSKPLATSWSQAFSSVKTFPSLASLIASFGDKVFQPFCNPLSAKTIIESNRDYEGCVVNGREYESSYQFLQGVCAPLQKKLYAVDATFGGKTLGMSHTEASKVVIKRDGRRVKASNAINLDDMDKPYRIIRQAKEMGITSCAVGFSTGKDSIVTMDLCVEAFGANNVVGYFQYQCPDLPTVNEYLAYCSNRWKVKILQIPHRSVAIMLANGAFRPHTGVEKLAHNVSGKEMDVEIRKRTGMQWVARGEKKADSLFRRGYLSRTKGFDTNKGYFFPVSEWSENSIFDYCKRKNIPLPPFYNKLGRSLDILMQDQIPDLAEHFPADYEKLCQFFPFMDAIVAREDFAAMRYKEKNAKS